jgi:mannose-1-phosphate guanylyltransferase
LKIVLLSGGSGRRLFPLSSDARPKQFLKILKDGRGGRQSMLQRVRGQIRAALPDAEVLIAANASQAGIIESQLRGEVDVVLEPERRDTFPAIALACAYLRDAMSASPGETVVAMPVDPYADIGFFQALSGVEEALACAKLVLMGIQPAAPESKHGYIIPGGRLRGGALKVESFVEKPDEATARGLIGSGALWNAGVFGFRLEYGLDLSGGASYEKLLEEYGSLEKISFDYKVAEREPDIAVIPYNGMWSDLGTWNALAAQMGGYVTGNGLLERATDTYIINELGAPIIALGTRSLVIAASPDGILVADLAQSPHLKEAVGTLELQRPMRKERGCGEYTVLDRIECANGAESLVRRLRLSAGRSMSFRAHERRDAVWTVASGVADFTLDGETRRISAGGAIKIVRGQNHSIAAVTDVHIIEVQTGELLDETDAEKFEKGF